jgi:AraC-like DNA-binding protein
LFVWKEKKNSIHRQKSWFKKWVMGRMTLEEIARQKDCSISTVQRLFREYLAHPPTPQIKPNDDCHLMIDGTYFGDICLLNYFDNDLKHLQYFEIVKNENYLDFKLGLELLKGVGLNIVSITSDGDRALIMAINEVFPGIVHQRCVIHVQRMALAYLTRFPKYPAGKELRKIVLDLHKIFDRKDRAEWIGRYRKWEAEHYDFLNERTEFLSDKKLYKHHGIRQAKAQISNTLSHLFHYLDDPKIPKSNNGLECRFSYLKNNLRIHRGLSKEHRKSFLLWYNWFKYNS